MAIIDLGELRDDAPPARPPRAVGRSYRCLAVLLAALVTLAGAAPAPRRIATTVPGGPGAAAFVVDDRVYVVEPTDPDGGTGRRLVAYRVSDGRPRKLWRTPLPGGGVVDVAWAVDGRLLLLGRTTNDAAWETMALDIGTGRLGWRQPGVAVPAGDLVLLRDRDGDEAETRRIDVRTGGTLWSVPTTSAELNLSQGPAGVDRMVLVHQSGTTEVFDAASGTRLVARDLRTGEPPLSRRTVVADGMVLVIGTAGGTVTGYDLDRLDVRWSVRLSQVDFADSCGRSLCVYRQAGGLLVLDPATGAIRWTDRRWAGAVGAADGRLLVGESTPTSSSYGLAVVEEATGRLVAEFGEWQIVPRVDQDGPMVAVRPGGDGRLLIAELDPAAGQARIRDALPAAGDCRAGAALLVCHRIDGSFILWRNR
ncbi:PQQ-binding-like beta-propeller repeat protein [Micromonospora sp. NPDC093277]|uniref:outer membrane protein assembly factor BamB family protein n=1 Tax=Micromonospora sp. NPDC093277 TaxID=3364291 RepID=UPI0038301AAC